MGGGNNKLLISMFAGVTVGVMTLMGSTRGMDVVAVVGEGNKIGVKNGLGH